MGVKKVAFIVTILLTSIFTCLAADIPVRAIGATGTIALEGCTPFEAVYDSGKGEIFVNTHGPTFIISDSTNKVVTTINNSNETISGMAYDSGKDEIFQSVLVDPGVSSAVKVISDITDSVVATIPMGFYAGAMAYDSAKNEIFVGCENYQPYNITYSVWVILDINNTVVAKIPIPGSPSDLVYDSGVGEIFIADNGGVPGSDSVTVISDSNNTVVANTIVGPYPQCLAYDSGKGEVFVTDNGDNTVAVISDKTNAVAANTVLAYVTGGYYPLGIAYDSGKGEIYVANPHTSHGGNSVSVISDTNNTVIATIPHIAYPDGITYDSGKGELFVTNTLDDVVDQIFTDTITVLSDSPTLTVPSVSAFPAQVTQGQTSSLTANIATGAAPFTYQWFVEVPNTTNFQIINNATSQNYNFTTTTLTGAGNWTFMLQVTDATGATVNSTVQIIVNAPTPSPVTSVSEFGAKNLTATAVAMILAVVVTVALLLRKKGTEKLKTKENQT